MEKGFDALQHPKATILGAMGKDGKEKREERETEDDVAANKGSRKEDEGASNEEKGESSGTVA